MYIKDIIIDGFKSYATRTEIKSFDSQFTSITGLNGSGKSNILDAILFVLGLSHFQLARVSNLQELVYKFGHAGITKASVTIIFDNQDKKSSPPGFETMDTITVTRQISQGKSKYFLNGHNESNSKIKSLFKAVQLNIDNPHFLVQQGRITKIINLKPSELIAMLEETAGTALYNEKKKEALRTIQKKEEKVKEINELLSAEIEPQMDKLRKEKETFYLWKSHDVEIQRLEKQLRVFEYMTKLNLLKDRGIEVENLKNSVDVLKVKKDEADRLLKKSQEQLTKFMNEQKTQESNEYTKLLAERDSLEKHFLKLELNFKNLMKSLDESEKELQERENNIQKNERIVSSNTQKITFAEKLQKDRESELKERKLIYEEALRNIQACQRGDTSVEDAEYSIKNQLKEVQRNYERTQSEITQYQKKLDFLDKELETSKSAIEATRRDKDHSTSQIEITQKELIQLENEINNFNINDTLYGNLQEEHRHISEKIMQYTHKIREVCESDYSFTTNYRDPEPNFDRRKVKGRVFDLVYPVEEKFIKALDQVAGGKLKNIVVDNEQTSKLLMKKQCFNHFVNLMPNNKMSPITINENVLREAEKIAKEVGGFAVQASKLVKYDPELKNSIEYVFGGALVCSSTEVAKRIIARDLNTRCVTLDGDIHDPKGSLTGGYLNLANSILMKNEDVRKYKQERDQYQRDLKEIEDKMTRVKKDLDHKEGLKQDFEQKSHRLNLLKEKSKRNSNHGFEKKISDLQEEREVTQENIASLKARKSEYEKEISELEAELGSSKGVGNSKKRSQKDMWLEKSKKLEAEMDKIQKELKKIKDDIISMEVERENADVENKNTQAGLEKLREKIKKHLYQKETQTLDLDSVKKNKETCERQIKIYEKESTLHNAQIKELKTKIEELSKNHESLDKEMKRAEGLIVRNFKEIKEVSENVAADERKYSYLLQEKANIGVQGSEFDFSSFDYEQMQHHFNKLKQDQLGLQKRVNQKVEAMYDKVEKEFKSLIEKRETIKLDKDTLSNGMIDLDHKRKEAVEKCYIGVNKNFGKIFSTLLPGTSAKIQTSSGKDFLDGLEISVAFNNVWKTSLTELSGGQRSLLALSFMLSLLLYKPAPFYILDEIDAALDLSHTENIGTMISQHFPQSQFIIISLKEGMFNNANVLFKTQFVDGVSKVERRALKSKKTVFGGENSEEGKKKKQKKIMQIMETENI